jgi:hypothetical protein
MSDKKEISNLDKTDVEVIRRQYGDFWVPEDGQVTRSGRTIKPVQRFHPEDYSDDEVDIY